MRHFHIWLFVFTVGFITLLFGNLSISKTEAQGNPSPPVAVADSYTVHGSGSLSVTDNDVNPPDNGVRIVSLPSNGNVSFPVSNVINYGPNRGFTGTDSFSYNLCTSVCSNTAIVTVVSVNQSPIAGADSYLVRNGAYLHIRRNDSDPDGDGFDLGTLPLTPPSHGSLEWRPPQNGEHTLAYGPYDRNGGYDSFTYNIVDSLGAWSGAATVSLFILPRDGAEDAGSCPPQDVGQPVNVTNGNMWLQQTDYNLAGIGENIDINRFYNSIIQSSGLFGFGWSTKYDESIRAYGDNLLRVNMNNGQAIYFGRPTTTEPFINIASDIYGQIVKNPDNSYTLTFKDGRTHKFDANGKLLWQRDRNGNQTTLTYDTNGALTRVADAFGGTLTFAFGSNGAVSQISDSIGTVAAYEYYPGTTRLETVTYADNSKYKFEYTTINNKTYLTTVKDALDNILETHQYDSQGRATTSEKQGGVEKYTLDYSNTPYTTVTDALGRVTKYYFDKTKGRNVVTKTEGLCGGCGGSGSEVTTYEYDDKLNLTRTVDALSNQTTYTYDSKGNRLTQTDVLGTETYTYNSLGQVLKYRDRIDSQNTDPNVSTITNTYSPTGNLLTSKDALGNTTTLTYTTLGQPATVKDALNNTTTLTYDSQGRLTHVKDANNKTTIFAYDARSRLTSATNALSFTTSFQYDLNNRLTRVIYPRPDRRPRPGLGSGPTFITYTYDLAGRRTGMTDANNNTTIYGYDNTYRLTTITDPLNHPTALGYDSMSNLTSQTDALNNTTNYEYDDFNRLKNVIYPPAVPGAPRLEERLEYDKVGNVKERIDTANRETLYDYDTGHRLIRITDALSRITQLEYNARSQTTKVRDALNQAYVFTYDPLGRQLSQTRAGSTMREYDAVGNRIKRTDSMGRTTAYEYDGLNRLVKINYLTGAGNPVPNQTATYTYDDLSRLTSAVNDVGTVAFTYDNRDRITTTTDVFGHVVEYGYDPNGNRTLLKLDGANYAAYAYDIANRVTGITNVSDGTSIGFGYDNADRLTSRAYPNGVNTTYEYDGMSRLTRLEDAKSTATLFDRKLNYNAANEISSISEPEYPRRFGYDNLDRLTSTVYKGALATTEAYVYDAVGNRTASHRSSTYSYQPFNKLTSTQTATYNYDMNGNMVSKSGGPTFWRYTWDHENRMGSASTRRQTVRYKYDALGRRIQRTLGSGRESTQFIYDGLDVLADDNSGALTKYVNGPGIDGKLRIQTGSSVNYFLTDHLGSSNGLADSSGNLTASTRYDSFGNSTNNLTTRYQYTGREYDSFTGLHYYRARWYDANIGRFISEDPIGFDGGDVNLFVYVWNMPQSFMDPFGLQRKAANQRALERAKRKARSDIDKALAQPQVQRENLNPDTGNSWREWGESLRDSAWDLTKFCLGEIPTGKLPKGGYKASAPGMGELITLLEQGPENYKSALEMAKHKHEFEQVNRCVAGPCVITPYDPRGGVTDNTQKYEDLDLWQKAECIFWGSCGLVCVPLTSFCF